MTDLFFSVFQDIRDDMYTHNPEYEQLRELGRQIMNSDPSKAASIQQQLGQVRLSSGCEGKSVLFWRNSFGGMLPGYMKYGIKEYSRQLHFLDIGLSSVLQVLDYNFHFPAVKDSVVNYQ